MRVGQGQGLSAVWFLCGHRMHLSYRIQSRYEFYIWNVLIQENTCRRRWICVSANYGGERASHNPAWLVYKVQREAGACTLEVWPYAMWRRTVVEWARIGENLSTRRLTALCAVCTRANNRIVWPCIWVRIKAILGNIYILMDTLNRPAGIPRTYKGIQRGFDCHI